MASKTCVKCSKLKPFKEFYLDINSPDKRYRECKLCISTAEKIKPYIPTKTCKVCNIEKLKSDFPTSGLTCKLCKKAIPRTSLQLAKKKIYGINNSSKKRGAKGTITYEEVAVKLATQKGLCIYCGCQLDKSFHFDHMLPVSRGGNNIIDNIQLLCSKCNIKKSSMTHQEYIDYITKCYLNITKL